DDRNRLGLAIFPVHEQFRIRSEARDLEPDCGRMRSVVARHDQQRRRAGAYEVTGHAEYEIVSIDVVAESEEFIEVEIGAPVGEASRPGLEFMTVDAAIALIATDRVLQNGGGDPVRDILAEPQAERRADASA